MKKILVIILSIMVISLSVSCNGKITSENKVYNGNLDIFSLPSTQKVLRDEDMSKYYNCGKSISITLAKNEYESGQLIIHPSEDLSFFDLEKEDLISSSGKILPMSAITIYVQWYVNLYKNSSGTNGSRTLGYYPDALIPIKEYKQNGYNRISSGCNQGFTVTIKTENDTYADTYYGNFILSYGDKIENIPIIVTVWNFSVSEENHVKSAFGQPYQEELIYGQLNNTPQMFEKYTGYMLDHRLNINNLVSNQYSIEQQIAKYREYSIDKRVNAYSFTQVYSNNGGITEAERRIRLLIENSDTTHNLLKKEFIYAADEPYRKEEAASQYAKSLVDMLINLANEYEQDGKLEEYGLTWEDVVSIEILMPFTCQSLNTEVKGLRTYCPSVFGYSSEATRAKYAELRENAYAGKNNELEKNNYATTWWYTATGPVEPRPNQHIDNELYSLRSLGWMQYEYGVEGYLNWGAFEYADTETLVDAQRSAGDVYYNATDVIKATNGDGYIIYPGEKFGIDGPLPSLRQQALTDAFEDYEYLYLFSQLAEKYVESYKSKNINKLLEPLYRSIYTDIIAYSDYNAVLEARKTLASYLELLSSNIHGLVFVSDINIKNNTINVDIFAKKGTILETNGLNYNGIASGNGVKISVDCSLLDSNYLIGKLKNGSEEIDINIFLSNKIKNISCCDNQNEINKFYSSIRPGKENDGVLITFDQTLESSSLKAVFLACTGASSYEIANYCPSILISKNNFLGDDKLKDISKITMMIYNPEKENIDIIFQLRSNSKSYQLEKVSLMKGWNKVNISNVNKTSWQYLDELTDLAISISINLDKDITLNVKDLYYTYMR